MKKTLLTLTALALLATTAQARSWEEIKKSGTIKIATEGAFPPFNVIKGKELTGFEVDLANQLARQLGLKVQWVTQPFDSLLIGLQQDRYDFVIASHGITPERAKAVDFSNPHYCTGGAVVSRVGGPKTAASLKGKTVAVQVGTTYLENVRKVPGIKEVKTFPKDTDAQAALMAGRVDAWVGDKFTGLDLVKAQKGKLVAGSLLFNERIGMAVKKGNSGLLKELNAALAKSLSDGSYAKLSGQYFGTDVRCSN
ncbi:MULTISPECIES: ABC transporter substrate-binding protein [unclassified Deinococcus]|jgi:polar amino acid transport system substrate-binding protein|uniref:ABC transporter substrate-binding protein n=1 Tax=unclassified Deinococcus TaxID=2623546 RepID=UPI0006DBEDE1|nr:MULTISPECIES: ABC transporter substrate-binding protein [unclassified Deinococcus]MBX8464927.1 ABC transporter substrate-binding protein [Deinococcus sp. RIT780]MCD0157229.1 amino acid ABC transporter substrate-binding protein [Deinococcus sp. 6GRE01]MCD0161310.1 amino acid ABC transporter substrate-binding protein [Deinococcus sp. 6YEL10]MCD0165059.1 amino acid ABC transporter substrate-binding protein [Deinococcus sp. 12RED42]MCD0169409.1 amino acid ABC transporter substrate-binding prote